jgi:serine/threonine protein kinase
MAVEPGQVLLEKYRIERILGEGGMGTVARAHHVHLDQPVAIKFLLSEFLANDEIVRRFLREARTAVKLESEHVCRVLDVGRLDGGAPYIVLEFLQGRDLGDLLRAEGPLPPGVAVNFVLQACEALAEAHRLGIVHRDLKPDNLFITQRADGSALLKVLDFGISKVQSTIQESITYTHTVLGTPAYMSPEQMRSAKHVDARTDIWATGVVLYQLLSGNLPFRERSYSALCLQVVCEPAPPMQVPLPPGLEQVVARCLEKDPGLRYQNMAELAAALAPHAANARLAVSAVERISRLLGVARIQTSTTRSRPRSWWIPAVLAVLLVAAGLVVLVTSGGIDNRAASSGVPDIDPDIDDVDSAVSVPRPLPEQPAAEAPGETPDDPARELIETSQPPGIVERLAAPEAPFEKPHQGSSRQSTSAGKGKSRARARPACAAATPPPARGAIDSRPAGQTTEDVMNRADSHETTILDSRK